MAKKDAKAIIAENLDEIEEMLKQGLFLKQIAANLGLCAKTLSRHMKDKSSPLSSLVKKCREESVKELENSLYRTALGYTRIVTKYSKLKTVLYEDGKKVKEFERMEPYEEEVYYPPDTGAACFLLKNWGNYANEPKAMEYRKKELELKEKQVW